MRMSFNSVRFGALEIDPEEVIEFPLGLIGLGGSRYVLIDRNPASGFFWLQELEDPALALPVVRPERFFSNFSLQIAPEDRQRTGIRDLSGARVYATVRAAPNPREITANLRAPIVVLDGCGYQVINTSEPAPLKAPLFTLHP
jgi:flagellar assembly factor FliW